MTTSTPASLVTHGIRLGILCASVFLVTGAHAQREAADIPVADFFKLPRYANMALSPDGKQLAAIAPHKDRPNLVSIDLAKRDARLITAFEKFEVAEFQWINNQRLCFNTIERYETAGFSRFQGFFCINADGSELRNLSDLGQTPGRGSFGIPIVPEIIGIKKDESGEVYAAINARTREYPDVYVLNTKTGATKLLTFDSPGQTAGWVLDWEGVPRVAIRQDERGGFRQSVWYRPDAESPWQTLVGSAEEDDIRMRPIAFDPDGTTLYVAARPQGRDRLAIYRFDTKSKKLGEALFEHPLIDLRGGLLFSRAERKLMGISYSADKPGSAWVDERLAKVQAAVDIALPKTVNTITLARDNTDVALVYSYSDIDAGRYALLDTKKMALEAIGEARPWLKPELMAERRFIKYKARDGLEIPAWITLPKGVDPKGLPLIVNIHGGPWVRSYHWAAWGRRPEAQFFASRGYAVLEPEPRGSTGFGDRHFRSSFKQWGLTMQDDITDGVLHLIKEGIVDKDRMCLHGGSYGGYASLQGMIREPDLFKCANSFVAVTDLETLQTDATSDTNRFTNWATTGFRTRVGDYKADQARFEKTSPARNADKIKGAIMLTMGADDVRVPLVHGDLMRKAMERANVRHEYKVYAEEGHGFNAPVNVVDFYTRSIKFFDTHIGKK